MDGFPSIIQRMPSGGAVETRAVERGGAGARRFQVPLRLHLAGPVKLRQEEPTLCSSHPEAGICPHSPVSRKRDPMG